MEKRVLFCASTFGHIRQFHLPYLAAFRARGYQVWVAAGGTGEIPLADRQISLPFCKRFFCLQNLKAIFLLWKLFRNTAFSFVSVHTTLANVAVRFALFPFRRKHRPTVAVTCHGYLFHEADGLQKWLYLMPEKICAPVTDVLMVMNREDLEIARRHKLCKDIRHIGGMGVPDGFVPPSPAQRAAARKHWGFTQDAFLFLYAAEFSPRKDHASVLRAYEKVAASMPNACLVLAGDGALLDSCKQQALSLPGSVSFLGHVQDMLSLYQCCDAAVAAGKIEGLPFHVMEAMLCGLPVIARDIKGHRDLFQDKNAGILYADEDAFGQAMLLLYRQKKLRTSMALNAPVVAAPYTLDKVFPQIMEIYDTLLKG